MKPIHGGDLGTIAAQLGVDPGTLLDFSANINPTGPPGRIAAVLHAIAADARILAAYPDPRASALRDAIARRHGVAGDRIAIGNGSAAILDAIVRSLAPRRCVLPVPAFSEYGKILRGAAIEAVTVPQRPPDFAFDVERVGEAIERSGAELLLFANPNNPTGALVSRHDLLALRRRVPETCTIVVDEAFIDYVPHASLLPDGADAFIVVRSLTKFYGLAGMRAGYAIATAEHAERIEAMLPSWPLGTADLAMAAAVLDDPRDDSAIRVANERERRRVTDGLRAGGMRVVEGAANFILVDASAHYADGARSLRYALAAQHGIVVRACDDYAGLSAGCWIRLAVRGPADNDRLLAALGGKTGKSRS